MKITRNDEAILKVGGKEFRGWTNVTIEKSMRQITGSFGLSTIDIYPGFPYKWEILLGDECIIEINYQKVITGYIEDVIINYNATSHIIQFGGRDKTGDLADCSFYQIAKEWKGLSIKEIIKRVCLPFGIDIVVDASVLTDANAIWPETVKANEGETAFDLILKLCKMKAILPISYSDGKLTLTRAGTAYKVYDALEQGENILKGNLDNSNKDRYQTYIIKGQGKGADTKTTFDFTGPVGRKTDNVITRYRPIIIFAETECNKGKCLERAEWEKNNRAGGSRSVNYEVQGWTQSNGEVWPLNAMINVKDNILGINGSLLISDLSFSINEFGTVTNMRLVDPNTFKILAVDPIKSGFDFAGN